MAKLIDIDGLARFRDDLLGGRSLDTLDDGIHILYQRDDASAKRICRPEEWPELEATGLTPLGVLVDTGSRRLVVAIDEQYKSWAPADGNYGGTIYDTLKDAVYDFDGEGQTAAHLEYEACRGEDTANGYCAAYSRLNSQGYGYGAGEWWLPSLGELFMIFMRRDGVNHALSFISGAAPLRETLTWTSTPSGTTRVWVLNFGNGNFDSYYQTYNSVARPVSDIH